MIKNRDLKKRIIEISYKNKLSHIGSCLTAVDIIDEIFQLKKPDEKFVLSSGHAGLALYVVLEKYEYQNIDGNLIHLDAEEIYNHHGIHPDRCQRCHIDCSSGSLGNGLPIAVGISLSHRDKDVYCLISDGECSEGSIWEALRIKDEQRLDNLKIYLNYNGWGAYKEIPVSPFDMQDKYGVILRETRVDDFPFLKDQDAHYHVMTEEEYKQGLEILS